MRRPEPLILDPRDTQAVLGELLARRPAYLPTWIPAEGSGSWAMLHIFARLIQTVIERLNQAPDKNMLAYLDMLGINLIPAQAARAPVVFHVLPNSQDGRAPAGTRLGASATDRAGGPIIFETEQAIALASARLAEVVCLWPGRDAYADHSAALTDGRSFTLFEPLQPVPHILYLAHDTLFALAGEATLEFEFELAPGRQEGGAEKTSCEPCPPAPPAPLDMHLVWEYWDGQVWRPFESLEGEGASAVIDGTAGLTRGGLIRLKTRCSQAAKTKVNGIEAYWVRGRLTTPLPPQPGVELSIVDRIRLRSVIERPLQLDESGLTCAGGLQPDHTFGGGSQLDLTKTFYPFGHSPDPDAAFYFSSEEIFSKPGAEVTLCFRRTVTPDEEADRKGEQYELEFNEARRRLIEAVGQLAQLVHNAGTELVNIAAEVGASLSENDFSSIPLGIEWALAVLGTQIRQLTNESSNEPLYERIRSLMSAIDEVLNAVERELPNIKDGLDVTNVDELRAALRVCIDGIEDAARNAKHILEALLETGPAEVIDAAGVEPTLSPPRLVWEYWDGREWKTRIGPSTQPLKNFLLPEGLEVEPEVDTISFVVPEDMEPTTVNGVQAKWMRVRLESGSYNRLRLVSWRDPAEVGIDAQPFNVLPIIEPRPPALDVFFLGYTYHSAKTAPVHTLTYNDFQYQDHSQDARWGRTTFTPFRPVADRTPALYLGFDRPLPSDLVSLYFDIVEEERRQPGPPLVWEAWDGLAWRELAVTDKTAHLSRPGMLSFIGQPAATLPRFGTPHTWLRARLKEDGHPVEAVVAGLHLNAVWAAQRQTINDEVLGSSTGQPDQAFFFTQLPVLTGERTEIRELSGPRAEVEFPILKEELFTRGLTAADIRPVFDSRTGRVSEVWVRWQARPHLYFSGPDDRHYVIERARGRLMFGDDRLGKIPPPGDNNILARRYQAGGGLAGNVPAGAVSQLLGMATPAQAVSNPRPAEGGADGETIDALRWRGPQTIRHRWRPLSAQDYEALAREASPGVAVARALPTTHFSGRYAPGWVSLVIIPHSPEPQPMPSLELKQRVQRYLSARAPAGVAGIHVTGPQYLTIGVALTVAPRDMQEAGPVERRVRARLERFLHPLTGGPGGSGWPFGRDVYLSDLASILEAVDGVDYVQELQLLRNGSPQGERAIVPPDRVVAAGPIRIRVRATESIGR